MVEAVCCHDAHAISGTQIVLFWKSEVLPFTCDTNFLIQLQFPNFAPAVLHLLALSFHKKH